MSGLVSAADAARMARIIVCGSRRWHDRQAIQDRFARLMAENDYRFPSPVIVHGAARGADRLAADEAGKAGMLVEAHPADWERHGKRAGLIRNAEMAALGADLCIAFWDGASTGTAHMLGLAERHGIPTDVILAERKGAALSTAEKGSQVAGEGAES